MQNEIASAAEIISLIDLTSLNQDDNEESIITLCKNAITPLGTVAAVCVYPKFVELAANLLKNTSIKIATVVNFPHGKNDSNDIMQEIQNALNYQANEIDLVFPYHEYLKGNEAKAFQIIAAAREIC